MSFLCPVSAFSSCSVLFYSLIFSFSGFFAKKRSSKNTATLFWFIPAHPLQHQRFPHYPPCVFPLHFCLRLPKSLPPLLLLKRDYLDAFFDPQKVLAFCTPTKVHPTLPMCPPERCVIPPFALNVQQPFTPILYLHTCRFTNI